MPELFSNRTVTRINYWLPYAIASIVTFVSISLWYCLIYHERLIPFISIKKSLPWIILALGLLFSILFAVAIYLAQLSKKQSNTLDAVNQDFKKELIEHMHAEQSKQALEKA